MACLGDEARGLMVWRSVRWRLVVPVNYSVVSVSSRFDLSEFVCCLSHEIKLINLTDLGFSPGCGSFCLSCGSSKI